MVTPRTMVTNLLERAEELLPVIGAWKNEVFAFLKQERVVQTLVVTY